jgi:DNA modification methylase
MPSVRVLEGDCLDHLEALPENSVDAIVCDPPYGLGFMGKHWDHAENVAFRPETWAKVLRVLKPGGHLVAFSGTRTYHRMACAIEDAGFEIRDQLQWIYGSGFPKSHDIGKAIDKRGGNAHLTAEIGAAIKAARESRKMSATECDRIFCGGTTNWSWFEGRPTGQRAPTAETFAKIVAAWPELAPFAEMVAEVEREVIGVSAHRSGIANGTKGHNTVGGTIAEHVTLTAPATDAAREWQGWGTALKPACEPIAFARKPLSEPTVAANVLKWGTGALNIDGCRVAGDVPTSFPKRRTPNAEHVYAAGFHKTSEEIAEASPLGRWPANIVHDGSEEVVGAFPVTTTNPGVVRNVSGRRNVECAPNSPLGAVLSVGDSGSAARFFYSAKASKADRCGSKHPTVKPVSLMRWLCRLVTPKGGTILDPFAGSGTTGAAAHLEGFNAILIEREAEYVADIKRRIASLAAEAPLFEAAE